jgi:hypothetical protein
VVGDDVDAKKITIDRNSSGIYATTDIFVAGKLERGITIWCALDRYAADYADKSDAEIKVIAANHYNTIHAAAAALGQKGGKSTSESKAAAARANGRKGGRPRKQKK